MARKDLLKGLMGDPANPEKGSKDGLEADKPTRPRYTKGAIGAVSKSIADLKSRSVVDLDPFDIDPGGVQDRLEHDEAEHAQLMASISDHGQQVPVLVRPNPEAEGRFQIVYGRRRVLALRDLNQPVKAMIRDLDDQALVIAQGQENTARRDLSFIEKANFARQMTEAGYDRKAICDALSVDKTVISRMLSVASQVPIEAIELIGAAPGVGRDRWLALATLWGRMEGDADTASDILTTSDADTSDARFDVLFEWLSRRDTPVPAKPAVLDPDKRSVRAPDGQLIGSVQRGRQSVTITLKSARSGGFADWIADNIEVLHRDWQQRRNDGED